MNQDQFASALLILIESLQWSATAHSYHRSTARRCPICKGIHPDDGLVRFWGSFMAGKGHRSDCKLSAILNSEK